MPTTDPRVDAYIAKAAPFARPILERLRAVIHAANPAVTEDIKWGVPQYAYKGLFAATPAFKQHVRLVLWQGKQLAKSGLAASDVKTLNRLDRLEAVTDIPDMSALTRLIRAATELRDRGVKPVPRAPKKLPLRTPDDFTAALKANTAASKLFARLPPGHKREYVDWITGAKKDETRVRRITSAIQMIAGGQSRNSKYDKR